MIADLLTHLRNVIRRTAFRLAYSRQYVRAFGWRYYLATSASLLVDWALIGTAVALTAFIAYVTYLMIGG